MNVQKGIALLFIWLLMGCAYPGKTALLGAGIGVVAGGGAGLSAYQGRNGQFTARNVIVGGAVGGLLGAGAGYLAHRLSHKDKREVPKQTTALDKKLDFSPILTSPGKPVLSPARVESRFVDDQFRGNLFIPAHVEYIIVEPARWGQ